jgi:hypothetical protein
MKLTLPTFIMGAIALGTYALALWQLLAIFVPRYRWNWRFSRVALGPLSCAGGAVVYASVGTHCLLLLVGHPGYTLTMTGFIIGVVVSDVIGHARDRGDVHRVSIEQGAMSRPKPLVQTSGEHEKS